MKEIRWSDEMGTRQRVPTLWVLGRQGWKRFDGESLSGLIAVKSAAHAKAGAWSHTDYTLAVADDAKVVQVLRPFEGWGTSWSDLAEGVANLVGIASPDEIESLFRLRATTPGRTRGEEEIRSRYQELVAAADAARAAEESLEPKRREVAIRAIIDSPRSFPGCTIEYGVIEAFGPWAQVAWGIETLNACRHEQTALLIDGVSSRREAGWTPELGDWFLCVTPLTHSKTEPFSRERALKVLTGRAVVLARRVR